MVARRRNPYQTIFEIAQEGIWRVDGSGRVDLANARLCELLGYSSEELIGSNVFDFIDESDRDAVRAALARRRRGMSEKYDLRLRRKDGSFLWVNVSAGPMFEDDRYAGALCFISDITARREAEEELRRSEQRFKLLARATKDVIYEWDLATGSLWFNEGIREVFGHDVQWTDIQWWRDRVHPEDYDRVTGKAREMEGGQLDFASAEYRFLRGDGTWADVYARGHTIRDAAGQAVRWVGAMLDFTERNAAQRQITESQRRLQALFDNALDAIVLLDDSGSFIAGNPSAVALFGYPLDELVGLHFTDLTPPPSDSAARLLWRQLLAAGSQINQFTVRRKDGQMIDIEYRAVRAIQPGVHMVMVRDVTEQKRAVARLEALSRRLVRAQEEERGRIARELHDDIGQTLTAVALALAAARRISSDNAEVLERIDATRHNVELAVEQIRAICLGLRPSILDDLGISAALRWYLDEHGRKNGLTVHFTSTLPDARQPPEVETACYRIAQEAITNILRHSHATEVWVVLQDRDGRVTLTVRDNGTGFDAPKVLGGAGRGLGLLGMQERVRLVGGTIEITSEPGNGTRISVALDPSAGEERV